MIELTLADGKEMDIPDGSIVFFEEMKEDTNPSFPEARAYIKYVIAGQVLTAVVKNKYEDVLFESGATSNRQWLRLTMDDDRRLAVLSNTIVARKGDDNGCEITILIGEQPAIYTVKESRRQIKKWSERPAMMEDSSGSK